MFKFRINKPDNHYVDMKEPPELHREFIEAVWGISLSPDNGMIAKGHPENLATEHFYRALKGSCIELLDIDFRFAVATYSAQRDEKYLYTYAYQDEESWTTYNHDYVGDMSYRQEKYTFQDDVYFRVIILKNDCNYFLAEDAERINSIVAFYAAEDKREKDRSVFETEINRTVVSIYEKTTRKSLVLALLTDSHYTVNGTWGGGVLQPISGRFTGRRVLTELCIWEI